MTCTSKGNALECKLRGLVEGNVTGETVVYKGLLSLFGEISTNTCSLIDGRSIRNRILVFYGSRGSTVAPYVLYELKSRNCSPKGLVTESYEPMLIAGAVMAEIPLAAGLPRSVISSLRDGMKARLIVDPPRALFIVKY